MTEYSKLFAVHTGPELVSLSQWNLQRKQYWDAVRDRVANPEQFLNGLKCPQCSHGNLYDTGVYTSGHPAMARVKCATCNFKGERHE